MASDSPFSTASPTFLCRTIPTAKSISDSFVARPAPNNIAAVPTSSASMNDTYPLSLAGTSNVNLACGNSSGEFTTAGFPPCPSMKPFKISIAEPSSITFRSISRASSKSFALPPTTTI